ncbi:MAG TPA: hypothetical protein VFL90_14335 [Methylomirabilota bacterium]|nr:hypothetical protein [Methylomirabilota bacterium]
MQTVAGTFTTRADAERAVAHLDTLGIPRDRITLLSPGSDPRRVPTDEGEHPGTGAAIGAVVGGATGAAVGFPLGAAVTMMIPGIGPIIASGIIGALLFGAGGAAVGATLEESLVAGLPRDELFVYEDALRRGRSVVIALAEDEAHAGAAREALQAAGAESIDAARERWWIGLRSGEQQRYRGGAAAFDRDEALFRRGFEAALNPEVRGRTWEDALPELRRRHPEAEDSPAFRHGWEGGQDYQREIGLGTGLKKIA